MSPTDFTHTQLTGSSTQCIGAFFVSTLGPGGPSWVIGDAFLVILPLVYVHWAMSD